jgi:hypothetical protein
MKRRIQYCLSLQSRCLQHRALSLPVILCISNEYNRTSFSYADRSSPSISIGLLALKRIKPFPLHHPTIDNNPRLCLFRLHDAVVCHAPAVLATIVRQPLFAPRVRFCLSFDFDLIGFVVGPEGAVATADGAEAFVGGLAKGWKGDADGFAVASYLQAIYAIIAGLV